MQAVLGSISRPHKPAPVIAITANIWEGWTGMNRCWSQMRTYRAQRCGIKPRVYTAQLAASRGFFIIIYLQGVASGPLLSCLDLSCA